MWVKQDCPKCGCNDYSITPQNGKGYCFQCGYFTQEGYEVKHTPRIRSDYKDEIRQYYTDATNYYHSCLTLEAEHYLHQRGISHDMIQKQRIGFCPLDKENIFYKGTIPLESGLATKSGLPILAGRITFPYIVQNVVTDIRGRSLEPHAEVRYKSPFHDTYYRWADYPYYTLTESERIIITEGEIKAIISTQCGFPCVAIPGISSWRPGFESKEDRDEIILLDNQRYNGRNLFRATCRIARKLKNPKVATMPLFDQDNQDIDTFILRYGIGLYACIIDAALPYDRWYELQPIEYRLERI